MVTVHQGLTLDPDQHIAAARQDGDRFAALHQSFGLDTGRGQHRAAGEGTFHDHAQQRLFVFEHAPAKTGDLALAQADILLAEHRIFCQRPFGHGDLGEGADLDRHIHIPLRPVATHADRGGAERVLARRKKGLRRVLAGRQAQAIVEIAQFDLQFILLAQLLPDMCLDTGKDRGRILQRLVAGRRGGPGQRQAKDCRGMPKLCHPPNFRRRAV